MSEAEHLCWSLEQLDHALIAQVDPGAVAAIVVEPVQGEAGFIPAPRPWLRRLREICSDHGIVLIADEIQCGMGRTGKLWACEHFDVVPDLLCSAKSLGAGMPISAVTGRAEIMDSPHVGGVGGTYGGAPLSCRAAIESLKMIGSPEFLSHARRVGEILEDATLRMRDRFELIGDARGLGPMRLIELVEDRATKRPAPETTLATVREAARRGLILIRAGLLSNGIRLMPPLNIEEGVLREGLEALGHAVESVHRDKRAAAV
jgi:4-aminobutyrate aminotransferase/(S)-3-amino-2-methylpropionate transaminase